MKKIIDSLKKHALIGSVIVVLFLITMNTGFILYNSKILKETTEIKKETERGIFLVDQVWNQVIRNVDVGMRGFALTKSEELLKPLKDGMHDKIKILEDLHALTQKQEFTERSAVDSLNIMADHFIAQTNALVDLARMDSMTLFQEGLVADPGRAAWAVYSRNAAIINNFEHGLYQKAESDYENATNRSVIFQSIIFILAFPTLVFMILKIGKDKKSRTLLFMKLEKNNRDFIFNPGTEVEINNENEIIDNSIKNFKTATHFISQVSNGNFAVDWTEMNDSNKDLNQHNLAGELIEMRNKMKTIKEEDEVRNWISVGLATFSDVIRKNQDNLEALSLDILIYLTKYLDAQQSCLFVLTEDMEDEHLYLEMTACYAFNKKKFANKRIEIGQGMIGQTFLEGSPVVLTDMPNGYTEITSGLGHSTPTCLLIVPMKSNNKVEAVIEIAGFRKYKQYEVEFIEKVGEITASTLGTVKNTEKMKVLVDQFKSQTEQLKAQEEELRQNMEEMEATQEAIRRQDKE